MLLGLYTLIPFVLHWSLTWLVFQCASSNNLCGEICLVPFMWRSQALIASCYDLDHAGSKSSTVHLHTLLVDVYTYIQLHACMHINVISIESRLQHVSSITLVIADYSVFVCILVRHLLPMAACGATYLILINLSHIYTNWKCHHL